MRISVRSDRIVAARTLAWLFKGLQCAPNNTQARCSRENHHSIDSLPVCRDGGDPLMRRESSPRWHHQHHPASYESPLSIPPGQAEEY